MSEDTNIKKAVFAGGCFWCMEPPFEKLDGVKAVLSGYTGGTEDNADYKKVSSGRTQHVEAIEVAYDPERVSYSQLVEIFWRSVDPTNPDGQFADTGPQYKTAIFYESDEEKAIAEASKKALGESGRFKDPIVTPILPIQEFYDAEEYHQDYYRKNEFHYKQYSVGSGRAGFLKKVWNDK